MGAGLRRAGQGDQGPPGCQSQEFAWSLLFQMLPEESVPIRLRRILMQSLSGVGGLGKLSLYGRVYVSARAAITKY